MNISILIATAALLFLAWLIRLQYRRKKYPKDYGYYVCTQFGSNLGRPRSDTLRKYISEISVEELDMWLTEFELVDRMVDDLSVKGGSKKLGGKYVSHQLQQGFPFLKHEGLNQAVFLVNYHAMREGYDQ